MAVETVPLPSIYTSVSRREESNVLAGTRASVFCNHLYRKRHRASAQSIRIFSKIATLALIILGSFLAGFVQKARDPGLRDSTLGAGEQMPGLTDPEFQAFMIGKGEFIVEHSVQGTIPDTEGGLGPRFNANSCAACHAYPTPGGASPKVNPLFDIATEEGAANQVPNFLRLNGPVLVPRFKSATTLGRNDTSAQNLFTISGRTDAPGCNIRQSGLVLSGDNKELIIQSTGFSISC